MRYYLDTNILVFLITEHKEEIGTEVEREMSDYENIIIAQAIADKITLVSSDRKFDWYRRHGLEFVFNER